MTITKAQLSDSIYRQVYLPKAKSAQVVDSLLEIIKSTLENGEDVLISGFGMLRWPKKQVIMISPVRSLG